MDIPYDQIAAKAVELLALYVVPTLVAGGKGVAQKVGGKIQDKTAEWLWQKLQPKVAENKKIGKTLDMLVDDPEDEDARDLLKKRIVEILKDDPNFAKEISQRIIQVGDGNIGIGGNVNNSVIMVGTGNELEINGNIYIGTQPQSDEESLEIYRGYMAQATSGVSTSGLNLKADATSDQKEQMRLANVYIELDTKSQIDAQGKTREKNELDTLRRGDEEKVKPLSVLQAAAQNKTLVIKGDPGSGKSTFVNFLSFCLASKNTSTLDDYWRKQDLLPVIVILRDFAKTIPEKTEEATAKHLCKFIEDTLENKNLAFASESIFKLLEQGKALVFLDGLDEVQSVEKRIFVRDAVKEFATRYSKNHFVATCRVLSYQPPKEKDEPDLRLAGFPEFEVAPFTPEKINLFIDHWYWELMNLNLISKSEADESIKNLKTAAQTRQELQKLAPNPLLLTVMAIVNTHRGKLPDSRVYLYQDAIDILLWQWERKNKNQESRLRQLLTEANKNEADLQKVIRRLAYEAHAQTTKEDIKGNALAGISELALLNALAKINKGDKNWATEVIEAMRLRAGLLLERDTGVFTFPHRSFQEFLAGTSINSEDEGNFVATADKLANDLMVWRESILWAVSLCVNMRVNINNPIMLAANLCPSTAPKNQNDWLRIWFAGEVLLEVGIDRVEESDLGKNTVLPRVQNRLAELLEQNALTPRERAEAGNTLAKLGDLRIGVINDLLLCEIPAGKFLMGSKDREKDSSDDEYPQFEYNIAHNYFMSRYPITNAQFDLFVKDGYTNDEWWTEAGLDWRGDRKDHERYGGAFDLDNHPVVGVTWYESYAFTRWATKNVERLTLNVWRNGKIEPLPLESGKYEIRLPSEAEWERAARGGNSFRYPWGR